MNRESIHDLNNFIYGSFRESIVFLLNKKKFVLSMMHPGGLSDRSVLSMMHSGSFGTHFFSFSKKPVYIECCFMPEVSIDSFYHMNLSFLLYSVICIT
jgi:hypothetical protein